MLGVAADAVADGLGDEPVAGGEGPEDGAAADAGRLGHGIDGRGQAPVGENGAGRPQDALAGGIAVVAVSHAAHGSSARRLDG